MTHVCKNLKAMCSYAEELRKSKSLQIIDFVLSAVLNSIYSSERECFLIYPQAFLRTVYFARTLAQSAVAPRKWSLLLGLTCVTSCRPWFPMYRHVAFIFASLVYNCRIAEEPVQVVRVPMEERSEIASTHKRKSADRVTRSTAVFMDSGPSALPPGDLISKALVRQIADHAPPRPCSSFCLAAVEMDFRFLLVICSEPCCSSGFARSNIHAFKLVRELHTRVAHECPLLALGVTSGDRIHLRHTCIPNWSEHFELV